MEPPERHRHRLRWHRARRGDGAVRRSPSAAAASTPRSRVIASSPGASSSEAAASRLAAAATDVAREEVAVIAAEATRSWRELLFNALVSGPAAGDRRAHARDAERLGTVGPAARRPASPRTSAPPAGPRLRRLRAGRAAAGRGRRPGPARAACGRADPDVRAARRPARRSRPPGHRNGRRRPGRSASAGLRARGATTCVVERSGDRIERLRLRTGSYANWPAVAHAAVGDLLPDFPLINKSFEALLRLRGPLMLTLLRDLRRLRRELDLPRPERGRSLAVRHVDAGSCNGCEHELTLVTSPYSDLERFGVGVVASPVTPTSCSSPERSRAGCSAAARGVRRHAGAAARRRARRLRARLQRARQPRRGSSARSRRSCPSTCASRAARRRRRRSRPGCCGCSTPAEPRSGRVRGWSSGSTRSPS